MKWAATSFLALLALFNNATADTFSFHRRVNPISEILTAGNLTTFRDELIKYNLMSDLMNKQGLVTVFAPVDNAFVSNTTRNNSAQRLQLAWKDMTNEQRTKMLRRCLVFDQKLLPIDMKNDMILRSASDEQLRINVYPGMRLVNGHLLSLNPALQTHDIIVYSIPHLLRGPQADETILSALSTRSREQRFSTLSRLINSAGLKDAFGSGGPFTLFAPTNDAFNSYSDKSKLNSIMDSPILQRKLINSHAMNGTFYLMGLLSSPEQHTLDGGSNRIFLAGPGDVRVGEARIKVGEEEPILTTNGIIYSIDRIITAG